MHPSGSLPGVTLRHAIPATSMAAATCPPKAERRQSRGAGQQQSVHNKRAGRLSSCRTSMKSSVGAGCCASTDIKCHYTPEAGGAL